ITHFFFVVKEDTAEILALFDHNGRKAINSTSGFLII
ncbi:MAG: hypothetical protein JWM99_2165, partial [Verrucomicrobiales bacterium]|nr:hypothetical protein [Verrucomicrobiales bacterium]